jgi:Domain of unknown function (DU1801)
MPKYQKAADFLDAQPVVWQPLLEALCDAMLSSDPHLRLGIKFNTIFFIRKSWVAYIGKITKASLEVCFIRGPELSNEQGLLEAKGRISVRGITFSSVQHFEAQLDAFLEIVQEAYLIDDNSTDTAFQSMVKLAKQHKK